MAEITQRSPDSSPSSSRTTQQVGTSGMESVWGDIQIDQRPPVEKRKKFQQVTDTDIENDPDKNQNNPVRPVDGETLRNIWLRNMGYQPGSFEMTQVPEGGRIRFLFKPTYDQENGVDNWHVQGFDSSGSSLGAGTISTWRGRGSIITTKDGRKLTIFRPNLIVRR